VPLKRPCRRDQGAAHAGGFRSRSIAFADAGLLPRARIDQRAREAAGGVAHEGELLTDAQKAEARRRAEGATLAELARSHGVGKSTISRLTA
jgi:hypothetical protein